MLLGNIPETQYTKRSEAVNTWVLCDGSGSRITEMSSQSNLNTEFSPLLKNHKYEMPLLNPSPMETAPPTESGVHQGLLLRLLVEGVGWSPLEIPGACVPGACRTVGTLWPFTGRDGDTKAIKPVESIPETMRIC